MSGAEEIADVIICKLLQIYARMPIRHAEVERASKT